MKDMIFVHFRAPETLETFHTTRQQPNEPLPMRGDYVDVGGSLWEVSGRHLMYGGGFEGIRECVVLVRLVSEASDG